MNIHNLNKSTSGLRSGKTHNDRLQDIYPSNGSLNADSVKVLKQFGSETVKHTLCVLETHKLCIFFAYHFYFVK